MPLDGGDGDPSHIPYLLYNRKYLLSRGNIWQFVAGGAVLRLPPRRRAFALCPQAGGALRAMRRRCKIMAKVWILFDKQGADVV